MILRRGCVLAKCECELLSCGNASAFDPPCRWDHPPPAGCPDMLWNSPGPQLRLW